MTMSGPVLFGLGRTVVTSDVAHAVEVGVFQETDLFGLLCRHQRGDWGEMDEEDRMANNEALKDPENQRLFSAYDLLDQKIWVITDAPFTDAAVTTILFPEDY